MITKDDLVEILDSYLGRDVNKTFEPIADKILVEINPDWEGEGITCLDKTTIVSHEDLPDTLTDKKVYIQIKEIK